MIVLIFGLESAPLSVIFKIIEELTEDTSSVINTLRLRQNGRHFTDDIFKCIFLNENMFEFRLKFHWFVPKGSIKNIPALVQIMAWHRPRWQAIIWTIEGQFTDRYMRHSASMS